MSEGMVLLVAGMLNQNYGDKFHGMHRSREHDLRRNELIET